MKNQPVKSLKLAMKLMMKFYATLIQLLDTPGYNSTKLPGCNSCGGVSITILNKLAVYSIAYMYYAVVNLPMYVKKQFQNHIVVADELNIDLRSCCARTVEQFGYH